MLGGPSTRFTTKVVAFLFGMIALAGASAVPVVAAADRTPPTTPTNLRVISMTPYTVTLAWNPSTDNSGKFSYVICCANVSSQTAGQSATSVVYRNGLEAGRSFTLRMYAVDAAGNYSKPSNSVTFTLPRDTIPPTKPVVGVSDVGPTHVSLNWSSIEDGPHVWFFVYKDGHPIIYGSPSTSGTAFFLEPATIYTFTVRAHDFGGNFSPMSDPVVVTTKPSNPNDTTPPTTPANLREDHWDDGEIHLTWDQSTDDLDAQWIIRYDVYVNGVWSDSTIGSGRSIVYGNAGQNVITVVAVDTAKNQSQPATVVVVF